MPAHVVGAILAGGCSRRMGGRDKALLPLGGRPLLRHVIGRVLPQVAELCLCVERHTPAYESFGLTQLPDPVPGHHGPLGGLLSALRHSAEGCEWVMLTPCDAPFLPADLAVVLADAAEAAGRTCAVVRFCGELQPTFSIWHRRLLPKLEQAVLVERLAGFKQFLQTLDFVSCDWAEPGDGKPPPFLNINDPAELRAAAGWIHQVTGEGSLCSA